MGPKLRGSQRPGGAPGASASPWGNEIIKGPKCSKCGGAVAQAGKCLPCKHEDLGLILRTHVEKSHMWGHTRTHAGTHTRTHMHIRACGCPK